MELPGIHKGALTFAYFLLLLSGVVCRVMAVRRRTWGEPSLLSWGTYHPRK